MGCIYKITNTKNGKFYIGSTINEKRRKTIHFSKLRKNKHCNPHLQSAWNKYGETSFNFEIIEVCLEGYSDLLILEQRWITQTDACNKGYNLNPLVSQPPITKGFKKPKSGKNGFGELINPNGEIVKFFGIREFSRQNGLNHVSVSLLIKGKMKNHRGWKSTIPFEGYKFTKSHKEKISKSLKGTKRPENVCEKIRNSHIGKKHSEETKKKISKALNKKSYAGNSKACY